MACDSVLQRHQPSGIRAACTAAQLAIGMGTGWRAGSEASYPFRHSNNYFRQPRGSEARVLSPLVAVLAPTASMGFWGDLQRNIDYSATRMARGAASHKQTIIEVGSAAV